MRRREFSTRAEPFDLTARVKFALFNFASYTHLLSSVTSNKFTSCQFLKVECVTMLLRRASFFLTVVMILSFSAFGQRNRGDRPPVPAPAASPAEPAKPSGTPAADAKKEPAAAG